MKRYSTFSSQIPALQGKLGKFTVGSGDSILLGPPFVFNKSNINNSHLSRAAGRA